MKTIRTSPTGVSLLLASLILYPLLALPLSAQEASADEEPEQPPVMINEIIINFTGLSNVNEEVARANMSLREGEPYDHVTVDRDIRSLMRTRLFEYVDARIRPLGDNEVDVIFDIRPKFRIASIGFEGNEAIRDRRLEREIEIEVNQVLNERAVNEEVNKLKEFYIKRGYSQVRVDYDVDRNPATGFGNVIFRINEGRKFKIGRVSFSGNEHLKSRKLRRAIKTKKWGLFSIFTGSGKFDSDQFEDDLETLRDTYRKEGYLDIEIDPADVRFSYPRKKRMAIDIHLEEGKQYRIGEITFEGNEIYNDQILSLVMRTRPGSVYDPEKLDEDVEFLEDFYGKFGYMETRVRMQRIPNVTTGNIDLMFQVYESEKFQVESIEIEGNTKTKSTVVIRELNIGPGETFDSVRTEASRMLLENTGYFEDVNVSPQSTNIPNRKDVRITFREGRTGNFSFGAGFSSLEKGVFFVELTQSNFDIFNWRGAFQGDGQKFRLRAQLGSESSQILLAFEEPWLFEKRLAVGFQIFDTSSEIASDLYDITRTGFEVYLRKRLIERIEGRISYRAEEIGFDESPRLQSLINNANSNLAAANALSVEEAIDNLEENLNFSIGGVSLARFLSLDDEGNLDPTTFSESDLQSVRTLLSRDLGEITNLQNQIRQGDAQDKLSMLNLLLLRDTRDRIINTFRGARYELDLGYAGGFLGGNRNFYRVESRNAVYFPITRWHTQTIEVLLRAGVVQHHGDSTSVPFEELFYLGGPDDLRGFEFREVGPKTGSGVPIGGKTYGMFSAEYSIGFTEGFRGAVFYDGGFVNGPAGDFDTLNWNDNWGVGIRISVMGTPLRLDYGIPLTTDEFNDDGAQFNFTFGTRL